MNRIVAVSVSRNASRLDGIRVGGDQNSAPRGPLATRFKAGESAQDSSSLAPVARLDDYRARKLKRTQPPLPGNSLVEVSGQLSNQDIREEIGTLWVLTRHFD